MNAAPPQKIKAISFVIYVIFLAILAFRLTSVIFEAQNKKLADKHNNLFHEYIYAQFSQILPQSSTSLVLGMLFGYQEFFTTEQRQLVRNSGLSHVLVASGMNLVLLISFIKPLERFWLNKQSFFIFSLIMMLMYLFITGFDIPILRAALMVLTISYSEILGRPTKWWWSMTLSAGLILIVSPKALLEISFQLSFAAVTSQILLSKMFVCLPKLKNFFLETILQTLSAQIFTMPIILANFGTISLVAVFANFFILWTVPYLMILGIVVFIASFLSLFLAKILALPLLSLSSLFWLITSFFGSQKFFLIRVEKIDLATSVGLYVFLFGLVAFIFQRVSKK